MLPANHQTGELNSVQHNVNIDCLEGINASYYLIVLLEHNVNIDCLEGINASYYLIVLLEHNVNIDCLEGINASYYLIVLLEHNVNIDCLEGINASYYLIVLLEQFYLGAKGLSTEQIKNVMKIVGYQNFYGLPDSSPWKSVRITRYFP